MQTLPPFGLSDHKVVLVGPKARPVEKGSSRKTVSRRDTQASRKLELVRYFSSIDWSLFNRADFFSAKLSLFVDTIHIGMDHIMPVKHHRIHVNDAPWVTAEFKNLIRLRASKHLTMETRRAILSTVTPLIESVNRSAASTSPQNLTISSPPSPRSGGMLSNGLPEWFPVPVRTAFSPVYTWMANSVNLKSPTKLTPPSLLPWKSSSH